MVMSEFLLKLIVVELKVGWKTTPSTVTRTRRTLAGPTPRFCNCKVTTSFDQSVPRLSRGHTCGNRWTSSQGPGLPAHFSIPCILPVKCVDMCTPLQACSLARSHREKASCLR